MIYDNQEILAELVELSHLEWANLPLLKTVVGRHVYYCIAQDTFCNANSPTDRSLKQVLNHPEYTDRAESMKLRELEDEGLISRVYSENDKRARQVEPTAKLLVLMAHQAEVMKNCSITLLNAGGNVMLTASGVSASLSGVDYAAAPAMGDSTFIQQMMANSNLVVL